ESDVSSMNERLVRVESDVSSMNERLVRVESDVSSMNERLVRVESDISALRTDVDSLRTDMTEVRETTVKTQIIIENEIRRDIRILAEGQMTILQIAAPTDRVKALEDELKARDMLEDMLRRFGVRSNA
ncbi:MAG: hypothetical protein IJT94_15170, partial [Oscillibacter sp.]|nr:hypothetical protein [Oscillibacter sp.]